jgi:peroxiredoxin
MTRRILTLAFMLIGVASVSAQQRPPAGTTPSSELPRSDSTDPFARSSIQAQVYVGQTAPDFELDDASGKPTRLSRFRGDWVILVFADRGRDLVPLQKVEGEMRRMGARLVSVTHEKTRSLRNVARRDSLMFVLLSDVTGQVAASYGMYDYERSEIRPGFLMIDRDRTVRMMLVGPLPPSDALARLAEFSITGL